MKLSLFGRLTVALFASLVLGLGMTACGGGTVGYMYVLGQQYNQVAGFKVDDYTGNLTAIINSPTPSEGSAPISIVIKPGGRYVMVLNQGTGGTSATSGAGAGIAVFSVGGDGTLTYQASYQPQGYIPQWAQFDVTGTYLYVLTKYSPGYDTGNGLFDKPNTDGNGAITVFAVDPNTGRMSLVTNSQTQINNVNTPFYEVGQQPFQMKAIGGCLFTINGADQSITPYTVAGSQLAIPTTNRIITGANHVSSITGGSQFIVLTDSVADNIIQLTVGPGCTLVPPNGGGVTSNTAQGTDPVYSLIDSTGKYLYVLNATAPSGIVTTPYSTISAYTINPTTSMLQPITGAPYTVGSNPVCMIEDSTNQYMYISNHNDGTVTGKLLDSTTGILSDLTRGATFPAVNQAQCLALSGAVD
jgi:6-phosphogluconolactonase (cycloisomerase 2 family)